MCGLDLGLDLENHPDLARAPDVGFRIAGWYWNKRKLNDLADISDFDGITKKVNGGFLGKKQRDQYYAKAKKVLKIT